MANIYMYMISVVDFLQKEYGTLSIMTYIDHVYTDFMHDFERKFFFSKKRK